MRVSAAFKSRAFWLLSFYLGALFIANGGFQFHQIPYFVEDRGFSTTAAAASILLVVWASGFGRVGGGWLLDQMDYRLMLVGISLLMSLGLIYLQVVQPTSLWGAMPFGLFFGLSFGGTIPLRGVLGSMIFGTRNLGAVIGLLQGTGVAAGVVGPLLMGGLRDWLGDYTLGIWILAGIALAALVPVMMMESGKTLAARARAM
jgi:OFA family oxalate/formate antiporter-like MFS transporter